jgi:outer membrane immunogenic protein
MLRKLLGVAGASFLLAAAPLGVAGAADMPLKAPAWTAPAPSDWSGFYLGINGGYAVGNDPFNQTLSEGALSASSSINSRVTPLGGLFGGQFGYNYQTGHWVFGLEGDIQWAGQKDTAGCGIECISETAVGGLGTVTLGSAEQKITWFGTARGRLGWANDGWLVYITGGGAWGGISATTAVSATGGFGGLLGSSASNTTSFTNGGWVLGGGTEVRIAGPWSAKFEYLYMDLGSVTDTLSLTSLGLATETLTTKSWIHDNIVRVGLNYKFNLSRY